jgi:hypothetical protein
MDPENKMVSLRLAQEQDTERTIQRNGGAEYSLFRTNNATLPR